MSSKVEFRVIIVNPPAFENVDYIREGRCMQSRDSWTALWPPLTLMYISSLLKTLCTAKLVDCIARGIDYQELMEICDDFKPDAAVINTAFPTIKWDLTFAERLKIKNPEIYTIAVGMYPTLLPEEILKSYPALDFAIIGEPELAVRDLCHSLGEGKLPEKPASVAYRVNDQLVLPEKRVIVENLDELPFPDRDSLPIDSYIFPVDGRPFTLISFSRGCPYPCIFCTSPLYYGKLYRRRSPSNFVDELTLCAQKYKIHNFLFWGECISLDKAYITDICREIIKKGLDISWVCANRADNLDEEILKTMKDSGCFMTSLGIESSSQEILDVARKKTSISAIEKACGMCRRAGIKVMGHFIFGLPGETRESAMKTIEFARKNVDFAQFYCAVPYPGTELYEMLKEKGRLNISSWQDLVFAKALFKTDELSPGDLEKIREIAFRRFYVRPQFVLRNLNLMKSAKALIDRLKFTRWFSKEK